ncbi:MAG: acyltransferase [Bacteroides sp.]|nr:acyltransferase [Bacteroides sp.]MCM1378638.1 acyltransferase [Bacteroides sp.]MCM1446388.1 acyltransferase [Prevotella sp.]
MTKTESDALNLLRWGSTIAIVVCHLQQAVDNPWAWLFNVGVQVFFFLSGFLYGGRRIGSPLKFYCRRFTKLYLPYALWVSVAITLLCTIGGLSPEPSRIVRQYMMLGNLPGLNHLWFMMVIFVCYSLLPAIDRLCTWRLWASLVGLAIALGGLAMVVGPSLAIWVALYYLGYFCGRYPRIIPIALTVGIIGAVVIAATFGLDMALFRRTDVWGNVFHSCLGVIISLGVFLSVRRIEMHPKFSHLLTIGGGYEVYLVHHLFILGPLSLMALSPWLSLNILIIIAITLAAAFLLHKIFNR